MTAALLLLLILSDAQSPEHGRGARKAATGDSFAIAVNDLSLARNPQYCGVQAVCILSRLYEKPIEFESACEGIAVSEKGSSLQALKDFLDQSGVDCRTVRATPRFLTRATGPFIAHFEPSTTVEAESESGHYVVVLAASDTDVLFLDPSSRRFATVSMGEFSQAWSGYALVPAAALPESVLFSNHRHGLLWVSAALSALTLSLFIALVLYRRASRVAMA